MKILKEASGEQGFTICDTPSVVRLGYTQLDVAVSNKVLERFRKTYPARIHDPLVCVLGKRQAIVKVRRAYEGALPGARIEMRGWYHKRISELG